MRATGGSVATLFHTAGSNACQHCGLLSAIRGRCGEISAECTVPVTDHSDEPAPMHSSPPHGDAIDVPWIARLGV